MAWALLGDERLLAWLRAAHEALSWTTSVCTGSLLLGAAGLLDDTDATTHWLELDTLRGLGARPVEERVVERGKLITAAGVSAGIDMALHLAARIAGETTRPRDRARDGIRPPASVRRRLPPKAGPELVALVRDRGRALLA